MADNDFNPDVSAQFDPFPPHPALGGDLEIDPCSIEFDDAELALIRALKTWPTCLGEMPEHMAEVALGRPFSTGVLKISAKTDIVFVDVDRFLEIAG